MATFTISLPDAVARQIDQESRTKGFATRSEFFRDVIRKYFTKDIELEPFVPQPLEEIEKDLVKTGKYSQSYIKSIISGLKKSSVYAR